MTKQLSAPSTVYGSFKRLVEQGKIRESLRLLGVFAKRRKRIPSSLVALVVAAANSRPIFDVLFFRMKFGFYAPNSWGLVISPLKEGKFVGFFGNPPMIPSTQVGQVALVLSRAVVTFVGHTNPKLGVEITQFNSGSSPYSKFGIIDLLQMYFANNIDLDRGLIVGSNGDWETMLFADEAIRLMRRILRMFRSTANVSMDTTN